MKNCTILRESLRLGFQSVSYSQRYSEKTINYSSVNLYLHKDRVPTILGPKITQVTFLSPIFAIAKCAVKLFKSDPSCKPTILFLRHRQTVQTTKRGVPSGSPLFAYRIIYLNLNKT